MSDVGDLFTNPADDDATSGLGTNPLLDLYRTTNRQNANGQATNRHATGGVAPGAAEIEYVRGEAIAKYGFAIPTVDALQAIHQVSPQGVIEIGAGAGYWAMQLTQHGVDVMAFDLEPAPSPRNPWFSGSAPWHDVAHGDHHHVSLHPRRSLLIVWPTKNEIWAAEALERYFVAGGQCVIYVGEPPGGRTGDDVFHAMLGDLSRCRQCRLGLDTAPCICGVSRRWQRVTSVTLPHWPGYEDDLHVYTPYTGRSPRWIQRLRDNRAT